MLVFWLFFETSEYYAGKLIKFLNCSGLAAGEDNGQRGYMLTFVIAYLRVGYLLSPTETSVN